MNDKQKENLSYIQHNFLRDHTKKYKLGTEEHKGVLSDVPAETLLTYALEEVLDLASYLYTLKEKLEKK